MQDYENSVEWINDSAQVGNTENNATVYESNDGFAAYYQENFDSNDVVKTDSTDIANDANLGFSADSVENQYIVYNGTNKTVSSYSEDQKIILSSDFQGVEVSGSDFIVKSSNGKLTLKDVKGKFVTYCGTNSVAAAYSYLGDSVVSSYSNYSTVNNSYNTIDAKSRSTYGILIGGNSVNDMIYAGSGGSSMWGGMGGNDTLTGGNGYDKFVYKLGNGNDVIANASDADCVNLSDINLSQVSSANVDLNGVTLGFIDGGSLKVQGNTGGMTYQIAEGRFAVNQLTGGWYAK